jgi:predicted XRE-type DNA-binding protein
MTKPRQTALKDHEDIGTALGLSPGDVALMVYKAKISKIAVKAIADSGLSVNEIVKRSGVARSKVSAVKNGATAGVSSDLLVKIIAATGKKIKVQAA